MLRNFHTTYFSAANTPRIDLHGPNLLSNRTFYVFCSKPINYNTYIKQKMIVIPYSHICITCMI